MSGTNADIELSDTQPGVVSETARPQPQIGLGLGNQPDTEVETDDEELENIEETVSERLMGLTEMLPDQFWITSSKVVKFSYWLLRRSAWVLGTSLAILALPPFLEQQRVEFEEMQNMQKKQILLGPNQPASPMRGAR